MSLRFRFYPACVLLLALAFFLGAPPLRADSDNAPKHKPNTKLWKTEKEQGETAFKEHRLSESETHFQAALAEAENFDAKDYRLAESLTELGDFYARVGRFAEAEPLLQRAAAIRHGDPNPLTEANVQFLLGFTCEQLRHSDDAEKAFERAQDIYSRKLGPDHPFAVRCMFYLGSVYQDQQDYAKAEPLLKRALNLFQHPATRLVNHQISDPATRGGTDVWIGKFRPDFAYALESLVRLGVLYAKENRQADSDSSLKDALKLIDERLAKNDPAASAALDQISQFYLSGSNYAAAEPFIQRYVAFSEKTRGADDPKTLNARLELAGVYERGGKLSEAEEIYRQVLTARESKEVGTDSDATTSAADQLVLMYLRQGRYKDAEPITVNELAAIQKNRGENLIMMPVLSQQAIIYSKLNRDAELDGVYKKEIAVLEKTFGSNNKALVKTLTSYAALLRKLRRDSEAEAMEARAKSIQDGRK